MSWAKWVFCELEGIIQILFDYNEALELAGDQVMAIGEGECGESKEGHADGKEAKTHTRKERHLFFFGVGRRIYL